MKIYRLIKRDKTDGTPWQLTKPRVKSGFKTDEREIPAYKAEQYLGRVTSPFTTGPQDI